MRVWTIPNILTFARVVAAPCVALVFVLFDRPLADWLAFLLFVGAALTDYFDGWLARRMGQVTEIGKMLDPIADKAMVIIALMVVLWTHRSAEVLVVPAVLIVMRETLVSGLREYLGDVKLRTTMLAKWKTTFQMTALAALLLVAPVLAWEQPGASDAAPSGLTYLLDRVGTALLWLAAVLTVVTGWDYFRKGVAHLRAREEH